MSPIEVGGSSPASGMTNRDSSEFQMRTYDMGRPRPPSSTGQLSIP
uniref:Unannotated protein n=1 Tax=freshwater metagenome TaxID=449393 RepID=A0A6J7Q186_9ZZZZ